MPSTSFDKISRKLEDCVEREDYYQAQQLCLSLYRRRKKKDESEAYDVLVSGARILLRSSDAEPSRHDWTTAASELAVTLSKGYLDARAPFVPANLDRIHAILDAMDGAAATSPPPSEAARQMCERFVEQSAKWCLLFDRETEAEAMHEKFGNYALRVSEVCDPPRFGWALLQAMKGNSLRSIARVIAAVARRGSPDEEDLLVSKVVLRFVNFRMKQRKPLKKEVYSALSVYQEETSRWVPDTPVSHFLQMALRSLEASSLGLLTGLRERYATALGQDASLLREVDLIIERLKPQKSRGDLLSSLFKTLLR